VESRGHKYSQGFFPFGSSTSLSSLFLTQIGLPIWLLRCLAGTGDAGANCCKGERVSNRALACWPWGRSWFALWRHSLQGVEHLDIGWEIWELERALGARWKSLLAVPEAAQAGW